MNHNKTILTTFICGICNIKHGHPSSGTIKNKITEDEWHVCLGCMTEIEKTKKVDESTPIAPITSSAEELTSIEGESASMEGENPIDILDGEKAEGSDKVRRMREVAE